MLYYRGVRLKPIFAVRMFDAFLAVNPWLTFAVGAFLFAEAFYHGIPVVMKPDPPQAFGIYFMSFPSGWS